MLPNPAQCLESWAAELKSRSDRVRNLIGSAHWLSDGFQKEEILRQFLHRHLPTRMRITRGFLKPAEPPAAVSKEIDVLITDSESELPWFCEGNLVITPPTAALAQIHVKTQFDVPELYDVLESGAHNQHIYSYSPSSRPLWFGAVFFAHTSAATPEDQMRVWRSAVSKLAELHDPTPRMPDCVAIINGPAFLVAQPPDSPGQATLRRYDCGAASAAVFLAHLYDSIVLAPRDQTRRGDWFQMTASLCGTPAMTQDISLQSP